MKRTDNDRDHNASDERDPSLARGFRPGFLPLGLDGNGLEDRQEKSQRGTDEGVHVVERGEQRMPTRGLRSISFSSGWFIWVRVWHGSNPTV